jgi:MFS family permease
LLSLVSLFTDFSSEMVYPLVPLFLAATLGAPPSVIGIIEGLAEATASLLKGVSGALADRWGYRKPFLLFGYGLAALTKPVLALASHWPLVLGARVTDRFGKGMRGSPRDALIADSTAPEFRGRAFGFHRSGDSIGAVLGPLTAVGILWLWPNSYRIAFLVAFVPGILSTLLILPVRDATTAPKPRKLVEMGRLREQSPAFLSLLFVMALFGLGNSSDMFLILRAHQLGAGSITVVLMFAACNLSNVLFSFPAGIVSDRFGRKRVIVVGFLLFAVVYLGFGFAKEWHTLWFFFALYGVYLGLTDGVAKALIVDLVPSSNRGTALGLQAMVLGLCTLPASLVAGFLWQWIAPSAAFFYGAVTAVAASILLPIRLHSKSS